MQGIMGLVIHDAKVWFTSDTHFGGQRTLELSKRPFKSIKEMNDTIVKNWNRVVGEEDTVIHLGDFGTYQVVEKLNGNILLLCGNYEYTDIERHKSFEEYRDRLLKLGFWDVLQHKTITVNDKSHNITIPVTHCPSDCRKDIFNLFGHIHKLCMVKRYGLNVGVDCHNFTPIDMETVLFWKTGIEKHYDENVFD